jgi:mannosyl-3-phosphoglycerate phosphatase
MGPDSAPPPRFPASCHARLTVARGTNPRQPTADRPAARTSVSVCVRLRMIHLCASVDLVIFTDLDGTLLDDTTYAWSPAQPALHALERAGAIVVLASSKTRAEMAPLARALDTRGPLIVENGGGVVLPESWPMPRGAIAISDGALVTLGAAIGRVRNALAEIAAACGVAVRGFGEMTTEEIASRTGLTLDQASLAAAREFDEPFLLAAGGSSIPPCLTREAEARGLRVTRGGRFLHLTGETDKGVAVRALLGLLPDNGVSIGLGDSRNDLEMLQAVDRAVIVPRPDGRPDPALAAALPEATIAPAPGPAGWNDAILGILQQPTN